MAKKSEILELKQNFEVTVTRNGAVIGKAGDKITVLEKNADFYYIVKLNDTPVYMTWKRKNFIKSHCKQ